MEMITANELRKIEKSILKISKDLDYLDPFNKKDMEIIAIKKNKLKTYIDLLTPKTSKPNLVLVKSEN